MTNRARSYLSAAFNYGRNFDLDTKRKENDPIFKIKFNPVTDVPRNTKAEIPSDRSLSESEINKFWNLIENSHLETERKILLRLLILFGGRRVKEVIHAPWSEFNLTEGIWDRPTTRDKKNYHVLIPLGKLAKEQLIILHKLTGHTGYLFGYPLPTDYAINQTVQRLINGKIAHFSPKCLRATAKTLMGKIGISKEARDRYHAHSLKDISSKHYDKFDYFDQKKNVIQQWEEFLLKIISKHYTEES